MHKKPCTKTGLSLRSKPKKQPLRKRTRGCRIQPPGFCFLHTDQWLSFHAAASAQTATDRHRLATWGFTPFSFRAGPTAPHDWALRRDQGGALHGYARPPECAQPSQPTWASASPHERPVANCCRGRSDVCARPHADNRKVPVLHRARPTTHRWKSSRTSSKHFVRVLETTGYERPTLTRLR